jgi:hypothetical protein
MAGGINRRQIQKEIMSQQGKLLVREAEQLAREKVLRPAIEEMKRDFLDHPVTQEIKGGNSSENISNTLINVKSKSHPENLFSFIGFENGKDPTDIIFNTISSEQTSFGPSIKYIRGSQTNNISFVFEIKAPDKEFIYQNTPMPWAPGLSWAQRIEFGIPGIARFLTGKNKKGSRSGGGIQVENQISPGARFRNVSYLSGIFRRFIENINKYSKKGL